MKNCFLVTLSLCLSALLTYWFFILATFHPKWIGVGMIAIGILGIVGVVAAPIYYVLALFFK